MLSRDNWAKRKLAGARARLPLRRGGRPTFFMRMAISYLLVFVIPLLFSGIMYSQVVSMIREEADRYKTTILHQVKLQMDEQLRVIQSTNLQVAWSASLASAIHVLPGDRGETRYAFKQLSEQLYLQMLPHDYMKEILVYLRNSDQIVTSSSVYPESLLRDSNYPLSSITSEQWQAIISDSHHNTFYQLEDAAGGQQLLSVQSAPIGMRGTPSATIVTQFDTQQLLRALSVPADDSSRAGFVVLINEATGVLLAGDAYTPLLSEVSSLPRGEDSVTLGGEAYALSISASELAGWSYWYLTPTSALLGKFYRVQVLSFIGGLVCVALGIFFALLSARRNSTPILNIMGYIRTHAVFSNPNIKNEYEQILHSVQETHLLNRQVMKRNEEMQGMLHKDYIKSLLLGTWDGNRTDGELARAFAMQFEGCTRFVVLLCQPTEEHSRHSYETLGEIELILQEVNALGAPGYSLWMQNTFAMLIGIDRAEDEALIQQIKETVHTCDRMLMAHASLPTRTVASRVHTGMEGIAVAYREALDALEYIVIMTQTSFITGYDLAYSHKRIDYDEEYERKLINCLKVGDSAAAKAFINEALQRNILTGTYTPYMAKYFIFLLSSTILKAYYQFNRQLDAYDIHDISMIMPLQNSESFAEMKAVVMEMVDMVCEKMQEQRQNDTHSKIMQQAIAHVQANYHRNDLSVSQVAEAIGFSVPYLSRQFKQATGCGLKDYIHSVRLENAKYCLQNTDLSVEEIAERVGYLSANSFIKVFKKSSGITPGVYRDQKVW